MAKAQAPKTTRATRKKDASKAKKAAFLRDLAKHGIVGVAAKSAGVNRVTAYKWRDTDQSFAKDWDDQIEEGLDLLEHEAVKRGGEGWEEPVFHKGEVVGHVRKFSDTLLMFMLKSRRPKLYTDTGQEMRAVDEGTGHGSGGGISVTWEPAPDTSTSSSSLAKR